MCVCVFVWVCVCVWSHTITGVCTIALLPTKPSSDVDSGFRHGYGGRIIITTSQERPAISHYTTRLCQSVVTLWDYYIHADVV